MDILFYILLFAVATVIIFTWGMVKEKNKSKDLFEILYRKAEKSVLKAFKNKNTLSKKDIENEILNIRASLFYSRDKLIINNPSHFSKVLIGNMLKDGIIVKSVNGYTLVSEEIKKATH